MSYLTQSKIAINYYMTNRVAQCAASEQVSNSDQWTTLNAREWAAAPGWDEAWEYALLTHEEEPEYDPGMDEGVITDGMILSQVQGMISPPVVVPQEPASEPKAE